MDNDKDDVIELHVYKSPKDGRTCCHVSAGVFNGSGEFFSYTSGFGKTPEEALEYALKLNEMLGQEIYITGDENLVAECQFPITRA